MLKLIIWRMIFVSDYKWKIVKFKIIWFYVEFVMVKNEKLIFYFVFFNRVVLK